jgi:hypothetical protein
MPLAAADTGALIFGGITGFITIVLTVIYTIRLRDQRMRALGTEDERRKLKAELVRKRSMADLASGVVAAIPKWTPWDAIDHGPPTHGSLDREHCPQCGRGVGFTLGPLSGGYAVSGLPRSRQELIAACLVDGPRAAHALLLEPDQIIEAACTISLGLRNAGWRRWANAFDTAVAAPDPTKRIEQVGLVLDALRWFGPVALPWDAPMAAERLGDPRTFAEHHLEVLAVSSAPCWPSRRVQP